MPNYPPGFPLSQKTPGFFFAVVFGGAGTSPGTAPKTLLLFGAMIPSNITGASPSFTVTAGTASVGLVYQIISGDNSDTLFGKGSELSLGCKAGFAAYKAATIFAIATSTAGGATAATAVITCFVSSQTATSINVTIAGRTVQYNAVATDTATTLASNIATAINNNADIPATAQNSAGVLTITAKVPCARHNFIPVRITLVSGVNTVKVTAGAEAGTLNGITLGLSSNTQTTTTGIQALPTATINVTSSASFNAGGGTAIIVTSNGPQRVTYTGTGAGTLTGCAGGTGNTSNGGAVLSVSLSGGAVLMSGGTGAETIATTLAVVAASLYDRYVSGYVDSTNTTSIATQLTNMAAITTGLRQQAIVPSVDTYANAVTFATGQNQSRMAVAWHYNADALPIELAAWAATDRLAGDSQSGGNVIGEFTDPAANLNGAVTLIPLQDAVVDRATPTVIENALNNGLTVFGPTSVKPGFTAIVSSITSRSLSGGLPNYSVYKTKIVTSLDFVAGDIQAQCTQQYPGYKLAPDPVTSSGVAVPIEIPKTTTPLTVKGFIQGLLKTYEKNGVLINVDANLPLLSVVQDTTTPGGLGRLVVNIPGSVIPDFDQIAGTTQQV